MPRHAGDPLFYVLDADNRPVPTDDVRTWGEMFGSDQRFVDYTEITSAVTVSTIFMGIDHRMGGEGPPLLFETMVFTNGDGDETHRYSSWDDAKTGHAALVKRLRARYVQ